MNKTTHRFLTEVFNKTAPEGHRVIKIITQSHSDRIMYVNCSCSKQHNAVNNEFALKVYWPENPEPSIKKSPDQHGASGAYYNNF